MRVVVSHRPKAAQVIPGAVARLTSFQKIFIGSSEGKWRIHAEGVPNNPSRRRSCTTITFRMVSSPEHQTQKLAHGLSSGLSGDRRDRWRLLLWFQKVVRIR